MEKKKKKNCLYCTRHSIEIARPHFSPHFSTHIEDVDVKNRSNQFAECCDED
jgi:hypothetical protein